MNNDNQLYYGSIDLTLLIDQAREKHSAFTKGTNGHIYAAVNFWVNAEADKYGNIASAQLNPPKEMKDVDKKLYIGNFKKSDRSGKPISDRDVNGIGDGIDAPPRQSSSGSSGPADNITEPISDLPF